MRTEFELDRCYIVRINETPPEHVRQLDLISLNEGSLDLQAFCMTIAQSPPTLSLPDHTQLPESDGTFVKNFQEHPQSILLTSSIRPVLEQLHPDGRYCIGQDSGIYWRSIDPPERGAEAPDWFYVPNVAPLLDGKYRRSYVMWKEIVAPLIAIEFVSGDGSEERDVTSPFLNPKPKLENFGFTNRRFAFRSMLSTRCRKHQSKSTNWLPNDISY